MEDSLPVPALFRHTIRLIPWPLRSTIKRIPGVAQLNRLLVSKLLARQDFVHRVDAGPAKGIVFPIRMPEDKNIWTGTYEFELAARLAAALKPGDVAYDIGGWHGFFTGVMAAQGARSVHVFEPLPDNIDRIRRLIGLNPEKNITLHSIAVGERDSTAELLVMSESSMAKLGHSPFLEHAVSRTSLSVPVRSLDAMVAEGILPPPDLMKIDVEGAEILVLQGGLDVIRRWRPRLFIEVHSTKLLASCRELLEGVGYRTELLDRAIPDSSRGEVQMLCAQAER